MSAAMTAYNMILNLFNADSSARAVAVCPPVSNETVDVKRINSLQDTRHSGLRSAHPHHRLIKPVTRVKNHLLQIVCGILA